MRNLLYDNQTMGLSTIIFLIFLLNTSVQSTVLGVEAAVSGLLAYRQKTEDIGADQFFKAWGL
jgi:hypothetical protein